ncbi:hypothetical protein QTP88_003234 [Uroleucon formosanum]
MNGYTCGAVLTVAFALCCTVAVTGSDEPAAATARATMITTTDDGHGQLINTVDGVLDAADSYQLVPGVRIKRSAEDTAADATAVSQADRDRNPEKYLIDRLARFVGTHVLDFDFDEMFQSSGRTFINLHHLPRFNFGKNSFLTGFGLGFLAFGLKKLLLPIIIGVQIVKSVALAALLPTLLGSVGKVVSKGVSNFASSSSHFGHSAGSDGLSDFEFKDQQQPNIGLGYDTAGAADTSGSETGYQSIWTYPPDNNVNAITASYGSSSNRWKKPIETIDGGIQKQNNNERHVDVLPEPRLVRTTVCPWRQSSSTLSKKDTKERELTDEQTYVRACVEPVFGFKREKRTIRVGRSHFNLNHYCKRQPSWRKRPVRILPDGNEIKIKPSRSLRRFDVRATANTVQCRPARWTRFRKRNSSDRYDVVCDGMYPLKYGQNGVPTNKLQSGNYYTKDKTEDFKVFHTIPASSHLLANYDPFYSPLLSRIDTVYKQLGYTTEPCRERLVCQMYKNPAKFAPYSNLVSAQLSRELNELRKPSSENPEILRFFKYMKAAKDGQDNKDCDMIFSSCVSQRSPDDSVPMMTTYNEINKLVQARNAKKLAESSTVSDGGKSGSSTVADDLKSVSSTITDVESVLTH